MSNPLIVLKILNRYNTEKKFSKLRRFLDLRNMRYEITKYEDDKKVQDKEAWKHIKEK